MKMFSVIASLLVSFAAIAGPEEHIQAQTCYSINSEREVRIDPKIPTQVCLESLDIDTTNDTVEIYSYFYSNLYKNVKLTSLSRKNEDYFSFKTSSVFLDETIADTTQKLTLTVSGLVDNYGQADLSYLTLKVEQVITKTYVEFPFVKNTYSYTKY